MLIGFVSSVLEEMNLLYWEGGIEVVVKVCMKKNGSLGIFLLVILPSPYRIMNKKNFVCVCCVIIGCLRYMKNMSPFDMLY